LIEAGEGDSVARDLNKFQGLDPEFVSNLKKKYGIIEMV